MVYIRLFSCRVLLLQRSYLEIQINKTGKSQSMLAKIYVSIGDTVRTAEEGPWVPAPINLNTLSTPLKELLRTSSKISDKQTRAKMKTHLDS